MVLTRIEDIDMLYQSDVVADISPGRVEQVGLTRNVFATMPFRNFRIQIYQQDVDTATTRYYFTPLSLLDQHSATCRINAVTEEIEMRFIVHMWNDLLEDQVVNYLNTIQTTCKVQKHHIQVLPFEWVILTSINLSDRYSVKSSWQRYQQDKYLWFNITCTSMENCNRLVERMKTEPSHFSDLILRFSMEMQKTKRRQVPVDFESLRFGTLLNKLVLQFPQKETILVAGEVAKQILYESTKQLINNNFDGDCEVVCHQESTIYPILSNMILGMKQELVHQHQLKDPLWDSVYWEPEDCRPDILCRLFNDVYNWNEEDFTEKLMKNSSEKMSRMLAEAEKSVMWNGTRFVPKPLTLNQVHLAIFRESKDDKFQQHNIMIHVPYASTFMSVSVKVDDDLYSRSQNENYAQLSHLLPTEKNDVRQLSTSVYNTADKGRTYKNGAILPTYMERLIEKTYTTKIFADNHGSLSSRFHAGSIATMAEHIQLALKDSKGKISIIHSSKGHSKQSKIIATNKTKETENAKQLLKINVRDVILKTLSYLQSIRSDINNSFEPVCSILRLVLSGNKNVNTDLLTEVVNSLIDISVAIDSRSYEFRKELKHITGGEVGTVYKVFDQLNPFCLTGDLKSYFLSLLDIFYPLPNIAYLTNDKLIQFCRTISMANDFLLASEFFINNVLSQAVEACHAAFLLATVLDTIIEAHFDCLKVSNPSVHTKFVNVDSDIDDVDALSGRNQLKKIERKSVLFQRDNSLNFDLLFDEIVKKCLALFTQKNDEV